MKKNCKISITIFNLIIAIALSGLFNISSSFALEDGVNVNMEVTGCNDNAMCDGFETYERCPRDCQPPAPAGGGGGGIISDTTAPIISGLKAEPSVDSSLISWNTNEPSVAKISWGKTLDYEDGSLSEVFYISTHSTKIVNLSPDTDYYFKLELKDTFGNEGKVENQRFKTLPVVAAKPVLPVQPEPPANVTDLSAKPQDNFIDLEWKNPEDKNFRSVRILRSEKFYPSDPFDGEMVYEGPAEKIKDEKIKNGVTYYYSVFSDDGKGNYSSGAIASAKVETKKETGEKEPPVKVPPQTVKSPFDDAPQALKVHPAIQGLSVLDFDFVQEGRKLSFTGDAVAIDGAKNIKISLSYDKVPELLKTIAVTLRDPQDESKIFSFLLRVNKDKSAYEATIAPLGKSGLYPMSINILDYKNQGLKKIAGKILVAAAAESASDFGGIGHFKNIFSDKDSASIIVGFIFMLILMVIIGFILKKIWDFIWRRKGDFKEVKINE